jgi:putative GTP pyrophosphokinase
VESILPMAISAVPKESKSQINKAGKILATTDFVDYQQIEWAFDLTNRWRACHAYPINTFQSTLRTKLKAHGYKDYIVAQRLKRLPTIIDKLKRYPAMQLTTMQDIGGLRCILPSIKDVRKLRTEYTQSAYFAPMIVTEKNYIIEPRDEDGYRSAHLVFKYENPLKPDYNGLKIEMQIRTRLQHSWATAVETMGTFLGQALKSRQGDERWLEFFAMTSSAFAFRERCRPVPRFSHLSELETYQAVANLESELGVLEKMHGFSIATHSIYTQRSQGNSYYLIILDSINRTVSVTPYTRDALEQAIQDYSEVEVQVTQGRKVEPVLVSAGSIESLRRAYPSFFLDTTEFAKALNSIIVRTTRNS